MRPSFPSTFYAFRTHLFPSLRRSDRGVESLATWRGKQSMEWRGGGRRAFVLPLRHVFLLCSVLAGGRADAATRCALLPALSRWRTAPPLALPSPLCSFPPPVLSEAPGANREPERRTATPSRAGTADLRNRSGGSESQSRSGREGRSWLGLSTPPTPPPSRAAIRWPGPRLCPRRLGGRRSGPNRSAASVQGKEERDLAHFSLPIDTVIANFVERRR